MVAESGKLYSPIYDQAGFKRAQADYMKLQAECLNINPAVKSHLSSNSGLQSSQLAARMEADPALYYCYDDLASIKVTAVDAVQTCLYIH